MTNRIKKISRRNTILFATIATLVIIATGLFLFIRQDRLNKNLLNAVEANDAQRVISLLDQGANPNSRKILDKKRSVLIILQTMFHLSKDDLNEDATPLLLALNPNFMTETNEDLEPPENVAMIEALLKHGANPNIGYRLRVNNQIFTPLYFAIFGHKKDTALLLLKYGSNLKTPFGMNLLPIAMNIEDKNCILLEMMVQRGSSVNKGIGDICPLHEAAICRNPIIIKFLLSKGAVAPKNDLRFKQTMKQLKSLSMIPEFQKSYALFKKAGYTE